MTAASRYRLVTSGGPLAAVALAVLHVFAVTRTSRAWRGDTLWGLQELGSSFVIGLPVLLVLFALPPIMLGGVRTDEALLAPRPTRARVARFGADLAPVLTVHLVAVVHVVVLTVGNGGDPLSSSVALTLLLQVLALGTACAFGRACGEVVRHPAAVMVAALAGVLLAGFGADALRVTAGSSSYAGLELVPGEYLVAAVVLSVATAVVVARWTRLRLAAATVGAAVLAVLAAGQVLGAPALQASGERPTECEDVDGVLVCVFPGYGHMLDDVAGPARDTIATFRAAGVDPHVTHIEQSTPGEVEDPGTVPIPFDQASLEAGELPAAVVRSSVLHPAWCPAINAPEPLPVTFDAAQKNAYHWLGHVSGEASDADFAFAVPAFAALPASQQRVQVQEFLDRNASCEGLG